MKGPPMVTNAINPINPNPDHALIARTRNGDNHAFATLWSLHSQAGYRYARQFTSTFDPDDLVAEAFLQILRALRNGRGPSAEFRPYMFATIRNLARTWGRTMREIALDDLDQVEAEGSDAGERVVAAMEARATAQAFRTLPPRWQRVLWFIEVEHLTPAQVSRIMGITPNSVSSLAFRAREGLRDAWIQMQVTQQHTERECAWAREHLGGYARQHLSPRHQAKVASHLMTCTACAKVARETLDTAAPLRGVTHSRTHATSAVAHADQAVLPIPVARLPRAGQPDHETADRPSQRRGASRSALSVLSL
jgi:RNA polymerase sigma factor (sigma-70 family)